MVVSLCDRCMTFRAESEVQGGEGEGKSCFQVGRGEKLGSGQLHAISNILDYTSFQISREPSEERRKKTLKNLDSKVYASGTVLKRPIGRTIVRTSIIRVC